MQRFYFYTVLGIQHSMDVPLYVTLHWSSTLSICSAFSENCACLVLLMAGIWYGCLLSINKICTKLEACSVIVLGDIVCALSLFIYFTIFLLYFGTVLTVWYILLFIFLVLLLFCLVCLLCVFVFVHWFLFFVEVFVLRGRRRRDRMVVGFTTTCAISAYHL